MRGCVARPQSKASPAVSRPQFTYKPKFVFEIDNLHFRHLFESSFMFIFFDIPRLDAAACPHQPRASPCRLLPPCCCHDHWNWRWVARFRWNDTIDTEEKRSGRLRRGRQQKRGQEKLSSRGPQRCQAVQEEGCHQQVQSLCSDVRPLPGSPTYNIRYPLVLPPRALFIFSPARHAARWINHGFMPTAFLAEECTSGGRVLVGAGRKLGLWQICCVRRRRGRPRGLLQ